MLEESVHIFPGTFVRGHHPVEPGVVTAGIVNLVARLVFQIAKGHVRARYRGVIGSVQPQGVVIDAHFQTPCLASGNEFLQRHASITGHISRFIVGYHRNKAIGAYHIVSVRLQVACHPVDYFVPFVRADVHILIGHSVLALVPTIFVHTPIQRGFVDVNVRFRLLRLLQRTASRILASS